MMLMPSIRSARHIHQPLGAMPDVLLWKKSHIRNNLRIWSDSETINMNETKYLLKENTKLLSKQKLCEIIYN
jgi:hypothetical protein